MPTREQIMEQITNLGLPEDNTFVNSFNEYADEMDVLINESTGKVTTVAEENEAMRANITRLETENNLLREMGTDLFRAKPDTQNALVEDERTLDDLFN